MANKYSNFWIHNPNKLETVALLSEYKYAISNFVRIISNNNIPVEFKIGNNSLTDWKKVIISADIHENSFDSTIGLALHEATHLIKSTRDFYNIKKLKDMIPLDTLLKGYADKVTFETLQILVNYIDDARIDALQYKKYPGYRGYYIAMMNRYFNSPEIIEGLKSNLKRDETLYSYLFRIINLANPASDLSALKGLKEIYDIIDLRNILRLKTTKDCYLIALQVFNILQKYIDTSQKEQEEDGDNSDNNDINTTGEIENSYSIEDFKILSNAIKKQIKFINGKIDKAPIDDSQFNLIKLLSQSKAELKSVQMDANEFNIPLYNVIVLKNITHDIFNSDLFPFKSNTAMYQNDVNIGFHLGQILGKKLQIRNDETVTIYNRKKSGKIEDRLIDELGFGNEKIFIQQMVEKFINAVLHISIDVSDSMSGKKLGKCITISTAIAKAATMLKNFNVIISLRGTTGDDNQSNINPLVAIIYNSKKDALNKIQNLFPFLSTCNYTPEGLVFSALQKEIQSSNKEIKSYFLSLCDGEPFFIGYKGASAAKHSKSEINKIKSRGIKVMGYYIKYKNEYENKNNFNIIYGKDGYEINVENALDLIKTLNNMFLLDSQRIIIAT